MTAWEITVTCRCHDPVVFGHIHCRGETQPWTQPPINYTSFTARTPAAIITPGGTLMPACEAGHAIRQLTQTYRNLTHATQTHWNWLELSETNRNQPQPGETC